MALQHHLLRDAAEEVIAGATLAEEIEELVGAGDLDPAEDNPAPRAMNASGSRPTVGPTRVMRVSGRAIAIKSSSEL